MLLILVLGLGVYFNSVTVPFYFDDHSCIENNPAVKNFSYFGDYSRLAQLPILQDIKNNFILRPVAYFSFALNYRLHGLDVFGYHVVNIAIHIFNAILVYLLLTLALRTPYFAEQGYRTGSGPSEDSLLPLFTGLLFVAHPIQTQAVTYICQRFISLATLFCLGSLVLYAASRLDPAKSGRRILYGLSLLAAILAMFTKETAFTLPLLISLFEFAFFTKESVKKRLLLLSPFLLTMAIIPYNVIGITMKAKAGSAGIVDNSLNLINFGGISRWDYLMTQFGVITTYVRLLLLPVNQNFDYDYPLATRFFQPSVLLPLVFLLLLFGSALYLLYRSARPERRSNPLLRIAAFGMLWFFITLSVESSIIPIEDLIYEHRVYLPSIGFFMALLGMVHVLSASGKENLGRITRGGICLIIALLALATIRRNEVWQDKISFWRDVVGKSPGKARAHRSLGGNLAKRGLLDEAAKELTIAIALQPGYTDAYIAMGNVALEQNRFEDALGYFNAALSLEPDNANIYGYLSDLFLAQGKLNEARGALLRALALEPNMYHAHNNLGVIDELEGRFGEAVREYTLELQSDPENRELRSKIARLSERIGR